MYVSLLWMEGLSGGSENLPDVMPVMPGQSLTICTHEFSSEHQDTLMLSYTSLEVVAKTWHQ